MTLAKIAVAELREPAMCARATLDEQGLDELAESIKRVGVINPLTVTEVDGGYEVVAGHRRLLAARRAGVVAVRCIILSPRDPDPTAIKLHENLYRQELTPVEEGAFFAELLPRCDNDTDKLCQLVKQTRGYVEGRLNMLKGDPEVLAAIAQRTISLGVGEALNKMPREEDRRYYLRWAIATGATVAMVRQWTSIVAAQNQGMPQPAVPAGDTPPPNVNARDVMRCWLCGEPEPVTDLEFWHLHRSCRIRAERELAKQVPGVGGQVSGG